MYIFPKDRLSGSGGTGETPSHCRAVSSSAIFTFSSRADVRLWTMLSMDGLFRDAIKKVFTHMVKNSTKIDEFLHS